MKKDTSSFCVIFDEDLCIGCGICMRVCPTKAIRIRDDHSVRLVDQCVGCGECLRVCPAGAIKTHQDDQFSMGHRKVSVAVISPVLFSQFPAEIPSHVIAGMEKLGYDLVIELSDFLEMFQYATATFIQNNRITKEAPWPLLSPVCPVVVRLIAIRFPGLLPHILPLKGPLELLLADLKQDVALRFGCRKKDILVDHITPCPSDVMIERSLTMVERKNIDRAFGINSIYSSLFAHMEENEESDIRPYSLERRDAFISGRCLQWGMIGGEIAGMRIDRSMAVSGVQETVNYLEKIELGMFRNMEYIEFRACPESCLGGPLTVIDKYMAKSGVCRMIKMYGMGRRLPRSRIQKMVEEGYFFSPMDKNRLKLIQFFPERTLSIESMQKIENILERIRGKNCGVCGAPDCRTFAEDVIREDSKLKECIVLQARKHTKERRHAKRTHRDNG